MWSRVTLSMTPTTRRGRGRSPVLVGAAGMPTAAFGASATQNQRAGRRVDLGGCHGPGAIEIGHKVGVRGKPSPGYCTQAGGKGGGLALLCLGRADRTDHLEARFATGAADRCSAGRLGLVRHTVDGEAQLLGGLLDGGRPRGRVVGPRAIAVVPRCASSVRARQAGRVLVALHALAVDRQIRSRAGTTS